MHFKIPFSLSEMSSQHCAHHYNWLSIMMSCIRLMIHHGVS